MELVIIHYQCVCKIKQNQRQFQNQKITSKPENHADRFNQQQWQQRHWWTIFCSQFQPASPEIEKRRQKRQNLSPDQKEAQNEKRRRDDREKRQHLSPDQKDAQNKKEKLWKKRSREEESTEATRLESPGPNELMSSVMASRAANMISRGQVDWHFMMARWAVGMRKKTLDPS